MAFLAELGVEIVPLPNRIVRGRSMRMAVLEKALTPGGSISATAPPMQWRRFANVPLLFRRGFFTDGYSAVCLTRRCSFPKLS